MRYFLKPAHPVGNEALVKRFITRSVGNFVLKFLKVSPKIYFMEVPRCPVCGSLLINVRGEYICIVCDPLEEYM